MKKVKSNLINMVCVLGGVAIVCSGLLAYVNNITAAPIKAASDRALFNGIAEVMGDRNVTMLNPNGEEIKRNINGKELTFTVYKTNKGTAVKSYDTNAFGGNLAILVGFDDEGCILGYTILEDNETPGLGAKCEEWFQKGQKGDIIGMNPGKDNMTVSKDGGAIDAITASTITSRAFLRAVNEAYNTYTSKTADASTGASQLNR